jgi:hypothetical protein
MGLFSALVGIAGVNLIKPQVSINIDSTVNLLVSDIKAQQIKAMSGGTEGNVASQSYGIYIEPTRYTLFTGTTYNAGDTTNFVVNIEQGITLSNNLTSSQIVFAKETGEIISYTNGSNIVVTHSSGVFKTININALGVANIL